MNPDATAEIEDAEDAVYVGPVPYSMSDAAAYVPLADASKPAFKMPTAVTAYREEAPKTEDPMRPEVVRGRYSLPDPETGKKTSWQRVSNLIKMAEDTYHLELWKQRNVAKGLAMRPDYVDALRNLEVKRDKNQMNRLCERAQEIAGAYAMSEEGTDLHKSCELAEFADGSLAPVMERHRPHVQRYLDALRVNGLEVVPTMVERVTVSKRYEVAGKFDNVYRLGDGSYVLGDKKTGDSLDLSLPSISGQLACYEDGINSHGVWDGQRYDTSIKVRTDFAIVVHLPSTRDEVTVYRVSLDHGHEHNAVCVRVRNQRRIKAKHVASVFEPDPYRDGRSAELAVDQGWLEHLNAAHTVDELIAIAERARVFGHWNQRLANQARLLATELDHAAQVKASEGMGS